MIQTIEVSYNKAFSIAPTFDKPEAQGESGIAETTIELDVAGQIKGHLRLYTDYELIAAMAGNLDSLEIITPAGPIPIVFSVDDKKSGPVFEQYPIMIGLTLYGLSLKESKRIGFEMAYDGCTYRGWPQHYEIENNEEPLDENEQSQQLNELDKEENAGNKVKPNVKPDNEEREDQVILYFESWVHPETKRQVLLVLPHVSSLFQRLQFTISLEPESNPLNLKPYLLNPQALGENKN